MAQSREHRRAAGLEAWLLILAALLPGCGGAHSRLPAAGHRSAAHQPTTTPPAAPERSRVALESPRMVTQRIGWAVADDHNGYPLAVVRTVDGGRTWRAAGPPGLSVRGLSAAFYSARDAWVTWSALRSRAWPVTYRTTDGGRTWARMGSIPIRQPAWAPDMVTGQLGWVTAPRPRRREQRDSDLPYHQRRRPLAAGRADHLPGPPHPGSDPVGLRQEAGRVLQRRDRLGRRAVRGRPSRVVGVP